MATKAKRFSGSGPSADVKAVRENQIHWGNAWKARDAQGILSHYAPSAVLYVPGHGPVPGVKAYTPFIKAVLSNPNFALSWTVDTVTVARGADLAYVAGLYMQHNPVAGKRKYVVETGSYVTVLKKISGRWLGIAEINAPGQ